MAVLRESPWYNEIEQRGVERGRQEGTELALQGIEMLLDMKFGSAGLELMPIISQINDLDRLKSIQQAIKTANSVEDLRQFL
jgi:predicted transposase YdaD